MRMNDLSSWIVAVLGVLNAKLSVFPSMCVDDRAMLQNIESAVREMIQGGKLEAS